MSSSGSSDATWPESKHSCSGRRRLDHRAQQHADRVERVLEHGLEDEVLTPRRVLRVVHRAHVQRADLRPQLAQVGDPLLHGHAQRARRVVDDEPVADLGLDRLRDRPEILDLVRRRALRRARVQVHHHAALVHHPPRLGRVLGGRVGDRRALLARGERARHGAGEDDGVVDRRATLSQRAVARALVDVHPRGPRGRAGRPRRAPSAGEAATPTAACSSSACRRHGSAQRLADALHRVLRPRSERPPRSVSTTTNSSPPSRATRSRSRTHRAAARRPRAAPGRRPRGRRCR